MSSANESVSVVVPVFNGAAYIRDALDSIRGQTVAVGEIIVVDDGSIDGTGEIVAKCPDVKLIMRRHSGPGETLNQGVAAATGNYLAFLDADDLWLPKKLELQLAAFGSSEASTMIFGHVQQFVSPEMSDHERRRLFCPPEPMAGIAIGSLLMRRADFSRVGPLSRVWQAGHFLDWYARARDLGFSERLLPDVVLLRRLHGNNLSRRNPSRKDFARVMKTVLDRRRQPGTRGRAEPP